MTAVGMEFRTEFIRGSRHDQLTMGARFGLVLAALLLGVTRAAAAQDAIHPPPTSMRAFYAATSRDTPSSQALTALGRALFFDRTVSASGRMACATCHDPRYAYAPPNARPVQRGGPDLGRAGIRAVPSLRYLQSVPPFSEHYEDDEQGGADQGPTGGLTWDGRAGSAHDQARLPLLSPLEMANARPEVVVAKVERGRYAEQFRQTFGADVFADPARAFDVIVLALEVFQQSPGDFYPYSSKYDLWLRGQVDLSAQERRGLELFEDPKKGNCASCHPSKGRGGASPPFTDFGFVALGVPRNSRIPANADPAFHDLGLCGPERKDLADQGHYCGMFRTPSLRNVATRRAFFHNGVFHNLRQVLAFYVQRDLYPAKWYPCDGRAKVRIFDDLPARYRANVSREPPLDRMPGDTPALTTSDIDDVIAFLETLTDADVRHLALTSASSGPAAGRPTCRAQP